MEIRLDKISYRRDTKPILDSIDFYVPDGQAAAIIGKSGVGKTTLLRMINGFLRPQEGSVLLGKKPLDYTKLSETRRKMGYVMQEAGLFPHLTIAENISLMGRLDHWPQEKIFNRIKELLELVNLDESGIAFRYPPALSGGQRQRAAIARALFLDPPLLLMDEPFAHLDPLTHKELVDEFLRIRGKLRKTIVLVTHDFATACRLGDRILLLENARIIQDSTPAEFVSSPKSGLAQAFIATIPTLPHRS
jgi:osmoprotectant transport system ATP-binding protein